MQEEVPTPKADRGVCLSQKLIFQKSAGCLDLCLKFFFDVPGLGQGGTAGVEIVPEGLEKPLLVDSDEACPSGMPREVN